MSWTRIGTPAHSLAVFANHLAALTPDRQAVYVRDPSSGAWRQIWGPAAALIGGGWDLYAVARGLGDLWRYDGAAWAKVGGPSAQFVSICGAAYALTLDRQQVLRFDRYTGAWTQIGGPADLLIPGGSKLYAAAPGLTAVAEYSRYLGSWQTIGGPAAMWVGVGGTIYGLAPDKSAVYRYDGTPGRWTKVGGPAATLIGGGSFLYATQPGTGKLWRYGGTGEQWSEIGTPGTGFVAAGRAVYALAPNKSAVYQFDDANAESRRLRGLLGGVCDGPAFGGRVVRGFLVKRLGGDVLAEHHSDVCFQPLSTLKLLPYLHTLIEVDEKTATLAGTKVSWVQPTAGTAEQMTDTSCLAPNSPGTQAGSATLDDALPTMMWESHNRTLDAVLAKYGSATITARAQALGLTQTEMYAGCPQPGATHPWAQNVTTLADLARLFEGVEALKFVKAASTRTAFRDNMIVLGPVPGNAYTSPITGRTTGPISNEALRPIVQREAGAAKLAIVPEFMKWVVLRGKGGGGGPAGNECGVSDFLQVSLPFKQNGAVVIRRFVVGWYVGQSPTGLDAAPASEREALAAFRLELHAAPIRQALATW